MAVHRISYLCLAGMACASWSGRAQSPLPDRLWQRAEIQDSQGGSVSEPVFRAGDRNIVIIHGINSVPLNDKGLIDFATSQCANVLVYKYPSGANIAVAGRMLQQLLSRLVPPAIQFDLIGYEEGGLVARAAKEPGPLNGGVALGDQVTNLVTIATPHEGLLRPLSNSTIDVFLHLPAMVPVAGFADLQPGSPFLTDLNRGPQQGRTKYFVVAGKYQTDDDNLTSVDSALGRNVLRTAAQAIIRPTSVTRLSNYPETYARIKEWIIDPAPAQPQACANISGGWGVSEKGTERCVIGGQAQSPEGFTGAAFVIVQQDQAVVPSATRFLTCRRATCPLPGPA